MTTWPTIQDAIDAAANDAKEAWFAATDQFKRCQTVRRGRQCWLAKNHQQRPHYYGQEPWNPASPSTS